MRLITNHLRDFEQAVLECFVAPNHILPKEFHNERTGYVSLAKIDGVCDKLTGLSKAEKEKAEKARRVELYRKQFENNGEIYYEL
jgi:hypothetical protein